MQKLECIPKRVCYDKDTVYINNNVILLKQYIINS